MRPCSPGGGIDEKSYAQFVADGAAWVALHGDRLVGFAAVNRPAGSVWALFVDPAAEGAGVGRALHRRLLAWAREAGLTTLRLTTETGSRAEAFYRRAGWRDAGLDPQGERCFTLRLLAGPAGFEGGE
jgi:GNAT superfamily N-acetyltransferase